MTFMEGCDTQSSIEVEINEKAMELYFAMGTIARRHCEKLFAMGTIALCPYEKFFVMGTIARRHLQITKLPTQTIRAIPSAGASVWCRDHQVRKIRQCPIHLR